MRAGQEIPVASQATIQQTMPGSVKQPTGLKPMPPAGLEARREFFAFGGQWDSPLAYRHKRVGVVRARTVGCLTEPGIVMLPGRLP